MPIELSCVKVQTVKNESKPSVDLVNGENLGRESSTAIPESEEIRLDPNKDPKFHRFECCSCGYIYDPDEGIKKFNIPAGTSFFDVDQATFRCPVCRLGFEAYKDIGPKSKPSGFEENLTYGFGFNKLPSGQKNVLIFGAFALAAACFLSLYSLH